MSLDSATAAQMGVVHELMMNHDRLTRTVTNLPDGIRTVTESGDSILARRLKDHVAEMERRVAMRDDPGLPMESDALHAIFLQGDKVQTSVDTTANGVVVVQTSPDSATVVALQRHAAEVTSLVQRGMAAMHETMMARGHHRMPH